ncbi:hypothetical protein ACG7TL_002904 [Trametes sanguinea]
MGATLFIASLLRSPDPFKFISDLSTLARAKVLDPVAEQKPDSAPFTHERMEECERYNHRTSTVQCVPTYTDNEPQ